jgi:hypothetical protein
MIWTEWDPLSEIIVGGCSTDYKLGNQNIDQYFTQLLAETSEDLDNLASWLSAAGITVHRPNTTIRPNSIPPMIPRDQYLVYGETIYSTFTSMKERYYDQHYHYDTFTRLFSGGYNWLQQPMPEIPSLPTNEIWYQQGVEIYGSRYKDKLLLHTATATKLGDKLIMNTNGPGTYLGQEWLRRNLPIGTSVISNTGTLANNWGHIDQCWFMVDDETVVCLSKDWVPTCLRNKRIIEIQEYVTFPNLDQYSKDLASCGGKFTERWLEKWLAEWRGYAQDVCFDTNVLLLAPKKILLSNPQPKLERYLESQGIECYSTQLRHGLFWESGVHCCTLDIARTGNLRSII